VNVGVILLLELADSSDQVVALGGKIGHLLFEVHLLLPGVDFLTSEDLELVVKLSEASAIGIMLQF
jgi:hypothetical protein